MERFYELEYIHSKHLPNYGPRLLRALCTRVRKIAAALRDEDAAADALKKQQQQEKKKKKWKGIHQGRYRERHQWPMDVSSTPTLYTV